MSVRLWDLPEEFRPGRFEKLDEGRFNFIPQGGGDYHDGHRCPGEKIAIMLVKLATKNFASKLHYDVPEQETSIPRNRFPTLPNSGFVMKEIRPYHSS